MELFYQRVLTYIPKITVRERTQERTTGRYRRDTSSRFALPAVWHHRIQWDRGRYWFRFGASNACVPYTAIELTRWNLLDHTPRKAWGRHIISSITLHYFIYTIITTINILSTSRSTSPFFNNNISKTIRAIKYSKSTNIMMLRNFIIASALLCVSSTHAFAFSRPVSNCDDVGSCRCMTCAGCFDPLASDYCSLTPLAPTTPFSSMKRNLGPRRWLATVRRRHLISCLRPKLNPSSSRRKTAPRGSAPLTRWSHSLRICRASSLSLANGSRRSMVWLRSWNMWMERMNVPWMRFERLSGPSFGFFRLVWVCVCGAFRCWCCYLWAGERSICILLLFDCACQNESAHNLRDVISFSCPRFAFVWLIGIGQGERQQLPQSLCPNGLHRWYQRRWKNCVRRPSSQAHEKVNSVKHSMGDVGMFYVSDTNDSSLKLGRRLQIWKERQYVMNHNLVELV